MLSQALLLFLEVSIGTGLAVLVLVCCTPLFRRYFAPSWKYWLWLLCAVRLLIPVGSSLSFALLSSLRAQTFFSRVPWISWIWLCGIFLLLIFCLLGYFSFRHQCLRWSAPLSNPQTQKILQQLQEQLDMKSSISAVVSMKVSSPLVVGLLRPVLVLPHENYSEEDLQYVLRHELLHCKRRDVWYKLLLLAACLIHWFNPMAWVLYFQAACDLETLCDIQTLENCSAPQRRHYSQIIINTNHAAMKKAICTTHFYGGSFAIHQRLRQIASTYVKRSGGVVLVSVVAFFLIVGNLPLLQNIFVPAFTVNSPTSTSQEIISQTEPAPSVASSLAAASSQAPSSEQSAVFPNASSESANLSPASSSEQSVATTPASSGVSSNETSSSESSSTPMVSAPVVKTDGVAPPNSAFVSTIRAIISQYQDGTADTSMQDPAKPLLMPAPAGFVFPDIQIDSAFSVVINQQGYGIVVPCNEGRYINIWVKDTGPSDAYVFEVTAVSFISENTTSSATAAASAPPEEILPQAAVSEPALPAASSAMPSTVTSGKPKTTAPKKTGLLP